MEISERDILYKGWLKAVKHAQNWIDENE